MRVSRSLIIVGLLFAYLLVLPVSTFALSSQPSATPSISLNPNSGSAGSTIQVTGSSFSTSDSSCSISGTPIASQTCAVSGGALTGTFTVANVATGSYSILVTGSPGGDSVSVSFTVTAPSSSGFLDLNPNNGQAGIDVSIMGQVASGVTNLDQSCSLSSPTNGAIITGAACAVNGGGSTIGNFTGSFIVGNVSPGQYVIEVTACAGNNGCAPSAGDFVQSVFTLTASSDFSLGLSSYAMTIGGGSSAPNTVTITSLGSFSSPVSLSTSSLPSGIHVSFSSNPATPPSGGSTSSVATVSVDPGTSPTIYSITITGTSGSLTHSQAFALTVLSNSDFTMTLTPSSLTLPAGQTSSSTITVSSVNGFNSPVLLSYSWLGSAPAGVTVTVTSPITPGPGTPATSTLTVSTTSSASTGPFTLVLSGSSGSLSHTANLGVTISGSPCFIATATYGSVAAPEVQLLRNFRDNSIMRTHAGSSFMLAFNAWYYSFSPGVANYISTHWAERATMKIVLYPLFGILYLTSNLYKSTSAYPELAVLLSGLVASSLIGAFYLGLPLTLIRTKARRFKRLVALERYLGATLLCGLAILMAGEVFGSATLLMISSATIVLSTMLLAGLTMSSRIAEETATTPLDHKPPFRLSSADAHHTTGRVFVPLPIFAKHSRLPRH